MALLRMVLAIMSSPWARGSRDRLAISKPIAGDPSLHFVFGRLQKMAGWRHLVGERIGVIPETRKAHEQEGLFILHKLGL